MKDYSRCYNSSKISLFTTFHVYNLLIFSCFQYYDVVIMWPPINALLLHKVLLLLYYNHSPHTSEPLAPLQPHGFKYIVPKPTASLCTKKLSNLYTYISHLVACHSLEFSPLMHFFLLAWMRTSRAITKLYSRIAGISKY